MDSASRSSDERRSTGAHPRLHQHRFSKLRQHFERTRDIKSKIQFVPYALLPLFPIKGKAKCIKHELRSIQRSLPVEVTWRTDLAHVETPIRPNE